MSAAPHDRQPGPGDQSDVIAHLSDPASYAPPPQKVERIDTHGAVVFLAGDTVYKIKRAVKFSYMDLSSLEKRHAMCRRELEINLANAPRIYRDVVAITRSPDGVLEMDGEGEPVEWAVRMNRFDEGALLSRIAERGEIDDGLIRKLAAAIAASHTAATPSIEVDGKVRMARVIKEVVSGMAAARDLFDREDLAGYDHQAREHLKAAGPCLTMRSDHGDVRRCHGDLHLNNIVVLEAEPVLFDALEFDDAVATVDTLYDLAFVLMDLDRRRLRRLANLLLNRYLFHTSSRRDLQGLAALPLFLSCRAAIRAMVSAQRERQMEGEAAASARMEARRHFDYARTCLRRAEPQLIGIGGLSGTGKSTLAAAIAPLVGGAPGAVHLRSDLERKTMFGVAETTRLSAEHYRPDVTERVYESLRHKADLVLAAGASVVVDAVHACDDERAALEQVAVRRGANFHGLWLTASQARLHDRVAARVGDASDATPAVVEVQSAYDTGPMSWADVAAGGTVDDTLRAARQALLLAG